MIITQFLLKSFSLNLIVNIGNPWKIIHILFVSLCRFFPVNNSDKRTIFKEIKQKNFFLMGLFI